MALICPSQKEEELGFPFRNFRKVSHFLGAFSRSVLMQVLSDQEAW